jgi:hypothetical protein
MNPRIKDLDLPQAAQLAGRDMFMLGLRAEAKPSHPGFGAGDLRRAAVGGLQV